MKKNFLYIALIGITLVLSTSYSFAQKAGFAQQFAVLKRMKPELTTIGVMGSTLVDKNIDALTHAAAGLGLKIVVGIPRSMRDIADVYRELLKNGAQVIFIPDGNDNLVLGNGFEYLRDNSLTDRIGIIVPQQSFVSTGALCSVTMEDGKLKAFVNQKIAQVVGANIPGGDDKVMYVTQ